MERLTRRVSPTSYQCSRPADKFDGSELIRANKKLGKLEDIEEELGIPLEVLFKALKEGIYWKTWQDKPEHSYMGLFEAQTGGFYLSDDEYNDVFTKEYGVTWALTREELK